MMHIVGDYCRYIFKNQSVYISIGVLNRIKNIDEIFEFNETQIYDFLGEDDIVKI